MKLQGLVKVCAAMLFCLSNQQLLAQQLKLGTNPTLLDKNALLELKSDKQGFLLPRIIKAQILTGGALYNAAEGMLVYITDDKALYLKKTTGWEKIDFSILTAGTGIDITGTTIKNIGVTSFKTRTGAVVPANGDYALTQLSDVAITAPADNQLLQYQFSTGKWINSTLSYVAPTRHLSLVAGTGIAAITALPAGNDLSVDRTWTITANNDTALWNANKIQGKNILTTAPAEGDLLTFTGGNWTPKAAPTGGGATLPSGSVWQINQGGTGLGWIGAVGTVLTVDTDGKLTYSNQFLNKNDNITLSGGEVTGSGNSYSVTANLTALGTPGTYTKVTVDTKGRVSYGTNLGTGDLPNNIPLTKLDGSGATNGQILKYNGTNWVPGSAAATASVTSINALTAAAQLLRPLYTAGTTSYGFTSTTDTHTLTIADASATIGGLVNTGAQTFKGAKTFNDGIVTSTLRINNDAGGIAARILGKDGNGDVSSLTIDTTLTINTTTKQLGAKNTTNMWNANKIQNKAVSTTAPNDGQLLKWSNTAAMYVPADDITGGASYGDLADGDIMKAIAPDATYRMKIWKSPFTKVVNGPDTGPTGAYAWSTLVFQNVTGSDQFTTQLYFDKNTLALKEWKGVNTLVENGNPWYKVVTTLGSNIFTVGGVTFANQSVDATSEVTQDAANFFWDNTAKELGIKTNNPSANLDVNGTAKIGVSGTVLNGILRATNQNPGSIATGAAVSRTFTVPGAVVGGNVIINPRGAELTATFYIVSSRVSANNTVTVIFNNTTGSAQTNKVFDLTVIQ